MSAITHTIRNTRIVLAGVLIAIVLHSFHQLYNFGDVITPMVLLDKPGDILFDDSNSTNTSISLSSSSSSSSSPWMIGNHQPVKPIVEFERQDGVVIVTKIHGPTHTKLLEQMLCLLTKAYNERMRYDVIIFTTLSFPNDTMAYVQGLGAPANVTFVQDNPGLQTLIDQLDPIRKQTFLERCNITTPEQRDRLHWYSTCLEDGSPQRLAYTWQAEFRALHIWNHPALIPYRYMVWMDTDGFCTEVWRRDPVAFFLQHQLVILFDHFPMGSSRGHDFAQRYQTAFNTSVCGIGMDEGRLTARLGRDCTLPRVKQIHGFFHITDLAFYRSPPVQHWVKTLIGDAFLSRKYDDQIAVTVPAAVLAPNRSWEMEYHGMKLNVFHNFKMDGKTGVGGFLKYWKQYGEQNFTTAWNVCPVTAGG